MQVVSGRRNKKRLEREVGERLFGEGGRGGGSFTDSIIGEGEK